MTLPPDFLTQTESISPSEDDKDRPKTSGTL
jgi:hypothetical protein